MKNHEVAEVLDKLAQLAEAAGEDRFKVIAYRRASTSVRNLEEDVEDIWKHGDLREIKFVGEGIAKKIDEYLRTGQLGALDRMGKRVPRGATELMKVPGIGPKTAYKLAKDYHVKSVDDLRVGLASGRLAEALGQVMVKKLSEEVQKLKSGSSRMLLAEAFHLAAQLVTYFEEKGIDVHPAGSLRRGCSTVGDIDILADEEKAADVFVSFPGVDRVIERGPTRVSIFLTTGTQVDLRIVKKEELGSALIYFTGSKQHNIELRSIAIEKGWKLNEYSLLEAKSSRVIASKTEEDVYGKLGLQLIPPELREARGEIEAAQKRELPDLVKVEDLRGDLQMHSTWSDGSAELEEMARAAIERGHEYIAFTDHSVSVGIANGLSEERFKRQWKAIDELNEKLKPFRILKSVEAEVRSDGSLDFDRSFFDQFDVVGASIHQSYKQSPEKLTARAVMALEHPSVDILFHPTNRIIGRREGHALDLPKVIRTAKDNGKMLEIDGAPNRLDLDEIWGRRAMQEGVKLVVDSDAHSTGELENVQYGIATARRAWIEAKDVANTLPLRDLLKLFS
jgi:DNA polymerase (family 10)